MRTYTKKEIEETARKTAKQYDLRKTPTWELVIDNGQVSLIITAWTKERTAKKITVYI